MCDALPRDEVGDDARIIWPWLLKNPLPKCLESGRRWNLVTKQIAHYGFGMSLRAIRCLGRPPYC
jgi:hypothetical protein